jgi:enamine deaminase RidA (YjgF/YER057c/UK114 family)
MIVVVGDDLAHIFLSGQMARNDRGVIVDDDMRHQIGVTCENLGKCLRFVGASFDDVVATSTHVLNLAEYYAASDERFKYFRDLRPTSTLVQVSGLGAPEAKIEITAQALIPRERFLVGVEAPS